MPLSPKYKLSLLILAYIRARFSCYGPRVPLVIAPQESLQLFSQGDATYDLFGLDISVRDLLVSTFRADPTIHMANITYSWNAPTEMALCSVGQKCQPGSWNHNNIQFLLLTTRDKSRRNTAAYTHWLVVIAPTRCGVDDCSRSASTRWIWMAMPLEDPIILTH